MVVSDPVRSCQVPGAAAISAIDRLVQPGEGPLVAEGDERVEQRRRGRPTGHRHADGHEQVTGLPAPGLRERTERRLELVGLEADLADIGDRRAGGAQRLHGRRDVEPLRDERCRVDVEAVRPQEADQLADCTQARQPFLDDGQKRRQLAVLRQPIDPAGRQLGLEERPEAFDQVIGLEATNPLTVQPLEPLSIEHRAGLVDLGQVELLDELVERQDLFLRACRPAEEGQVVHERLGDEALLPVVVDRGLALSLAHLGPVRIEDERQVGEGRQLVTEGPEQEDVLRGVREVVLAADHLGDPHLGVVDDDREVVERGAVGADDDEVAAEIRDVEFHAASNDIVERDRALPDPEADGGPATLGLEGGPLLRRQVGTASAVSGRQLGGLESLPLGVELLGRAEARICLVLGEELLGGRGVQREPLHLPVGRVRAAGRFAGDFGTLVPAQTEPVEPVEDVLLVGDRRTGHVGVLEAKDERAARVPCVEIVEQRRTGGPDMERAGRARRDPDAVGGHRWIVRGGLSSAGCLLCQLVMR